MPLSGPLSSDTLHHLIVLYLSVAYETDHRFEPTEHHAVVRLARSWAPDVDPTETRAVVDTAMKAVRSGITYDLETHVRVVGDALSPEQRRRVLTDLGRIARADGYLSVEEAGIIRRVRAAWGTENGGEQA